MQHIMQRQQQLGGAAGNQQHRMRATPALPSRGTRAARRWCVMRHQGDAQAPLRPAARSGCCHHRLAPLPSEAFFALFKLPTHCLPPVVQWCPPLTGRTL